MANALPLVTPEHRELIEATAVSAEYFRKVAIEYLSNKPGNVIETGLLFRGDPQFTASDPVFFTETLDSLRACAEFLTEMSGYASQAADRLEKAMAKPKATLTVIGGRNG